LLTIGGTGSRKFGSADAAANHEAAFESEAQLLKGYAREGPFERAVDTLMSMSHGAISR
jgi:hypothetical protein